MIARFRRRFVAVCMLSVAAVLVLILAAVNLTIYRAQAGRVDRLLHILIENGGAFPAQQPGEGGRPPEEMNPETRFVTRFFAVTFSPDGEVASSNVESIASVGGAQAESLARAAYESGKSSGWAGAYRYRVSGSLAVFVDASRERDLIIQLLVGSSAVAASALAVIFLLMVLFSRLAARPVAESLARQRQFITDASHELKTPLTIISANAEILAMNFGETEWSASIGKQSERMAKLIQSLIELTRIDEGAKKLTPARFNLSDAVYDTAMAFSTPAERRGLALDARVDPDIFVLADEASVRQLVAILTDNAVKYCDKGGDIAIALAAQGKCACLTVSNAYQNAKSLNPDRLFDRFYRADEARTGDGSYGLGLSIAKSIVDAQKGQIRAHAEDARFRITVRLRLQGSRF